MAALNIIGGGKANETRLKSAGEFGRKQLSGSGFGGAMVRQALFASHQTVKSEDTRDGLNWLRSELPDYWAGREKIPHVLESLSSLR